ncbi:MAG: hypothetical protein JWN27_2916 [Candidatus Eremiobacteraeota bacterium]|nr:hypothetical protein [Candidatus Eremiobacteraeota bacterium]
MRRRAPRQSERSDDYERLLQPPRATPAILAAATAPAAETSEQRAQREANRKTRPAPKARRRGPRGTTHVEQEVVE